MFNSLRFLVITSDPTVTSLLTSVLQAEGHHVEFVAELQQAMRCLETDGSYNAVLIDTSRQSPSNLYLLEALTKQIAVGKLWLLAPLGMTLWMADAERLGIRNSLRKPLQRHDVDRLVGSLMQPRDGFGDLQGGTSSSAMQRAPTHVVEIGRGRFFLAGCKAMKTIYNTVCLLAPVDVPVLILGESGVGKDVVACLLHQHSLRAQESYISINCAALPTELLESELFGYEAGAFTGAAKAKPGKFELAHRGTLLLDEIGEMSAPMQAKLLHVLQDGQFSRLGARTNTQVDVRVVAATNVNIENAIAENTFREDLYYRISAFTITIPPLRERRDEIPFLVAEMLRRHAMTLRQEPVYVSPRLMAALQEYNWPGNLRELSNFVLRILILHDEEAMLADLTAKILLKRSGASVSAVSSSNMAGVAESMRTIVRDNKTQTESRLIQEALDLAGWNRRHAASSLKISYRALLYKIQQYQLKENVLSLQCRPQ